MISIQLWGAALDPDDVTQKLGCLPSSAAKTGQKITKANGKKRVVKQGFWHLKYGESDAVVLEEKIELLLGKLDDDLEAWQAVMKNVDQARLFCGLFLDKWNEGFSLTASTLKKLSERGLEIDFDIYSPTSSWDSETSVPKT